VSLTTKSGRHAKRRNALSALYALPGKQIVGVRQKEREGEERGEGQRFRKHRLERHPKIAFGRGEMGTSKHSAHLDKELRNGHLVRGQQHIADTLEAYKSACFWSRVLRMSSRGLTIEREGLAGAKEVIACGARSSITLSLAGFCMKLYKPTDMCRS